MKHLSFAIIVFALFCSSCKTGGDVKWSNKTKLTILGYGKPAHTERFYSRDLVAAKWGLTYDLLGCVVTPLIVDSVHNHNEKVNAAMTAKFGADWEARMLKEVDKEFSNEQMATQLLDKQSLNIKKRTQLYQDDYAFLNYYLIPAKDTLTYTALAHGWSTIKDKHADYCYYTYMVDLKTHSVKLISDSISNFNREL